MKPNILHITLLFFFIAVKVGAQISPGDLSKAHAELEGILNCTKCHVLGEKVSNNKCLDCHQEIKTRINQNNGYHASTDVKGKDCASCHSDHHGRNFDLVRFEKDDFQHRLTGYNLTGQHHKIDCRECHQPDFIADNRLKKNQNTYLGLGQECLICHTDYHQKSLAKDCASCHDTEAFAPASKFNHNNTDFALNGKHQDVDCIECHPMEIRNGSDFQRFTDIEFSKCVACHEDPHDNKFGNNCADCHNEESFSVYTSLKYFDHKKTDFELVGKHKSVDCKKCHTRSFIDPVPHNKCATCHEDYHKRQFAQNGSGPDCAECHKVNGFEASLFDLDDHNKTKFLLEGAHLATPCFDCHKKEDWWSFREIGERCVDCHEDIHEGYIDEAYYPNQSCESCHLVTNWQENSFDHNLTEFELLGVHITQNCIACHGVDDKSGDNRNENFQNLSADCISCHEDTHNRQFEKTGVTDCVACHGFEGWGIDDFNHNKTAFRLEGKHTEVGCAECHKEIKIKEKVFVQYKFKSFECVDCHQ